MNVGFGVFDQRKGKQMSSIRHNSTQADAEYAALNHEFGVEHRLYLQCKHDLEAANAAMRDVFPAAHRLALELECLLLDTKDTAAVSKWWDSAHEALEQWREFCHEDAKTPNVELTGAARHERTTKP